MGPAAALLSLLLSGLGPGAAAPSLHAPKSSGALWSLQPIADPPPPEVRDAAWPRCDADRFVLAGLERRGWTPAPEADRRTWLRRVSFALTGLPPRIDESLAFLADDSPEAYERVVDRALASPAYAETWARHWLDLVRYADTRGHEFDFDVPNAWQYRDYVVRAFRADVPYDRFVMEHVAGDLLPPRPNREGGWDESILGTGWWWLGEELHSPVDVRADQTDRLADQVDTLSKAFLGLTVACARCHDHKFDPVTQRDYTALAGFALSSPYRQVRFVSRERNAAVAARLAELRGRVAGEVVPEAGEAWRARLAGLPARLAAAREVLLSAGPDGWRDVEPVARRAGVAAGELAELVDVLAGEALDDPAHPLALFARALLHEQRGARFEDAWRALETGDARSGAVPHDARLLVDYRAGGVPPVQDGVAFRLEPAGAPLLDARDERRPVRRILALGAAVADPVWDELELAPGTQRDAGRLDYVRSGRTLVTGVLELGSGRLAYLVTGRARVYAAVDGHKLLVGPLHEALTVTVDGGRGFRWVEHDLSEYAGHRAHLELTPEGAPSDFALACVVELGASGLPPSVEPAALPSGIEGGSVLEILECWAASWDEDARRAFAGVADEGTRARADRLLGRLGALVGPPAAGPATRAWRAEERALLAERVLVSPTAPACLDGAGADELFLVRGDAANATDPVPRAFLAALGGEPLAPARGSGRLALARALVDPANPLLARAWTNRVWQHLFGRGIAPSVDDLGHMGEPPTHPELLDHLAARFRGELGWSTRALVRELVLSATFRQASAGDPTLEAEDPANLAWRRALVRRLDGEALRDSLLAISGELDPTVGGPPVPLHLTPFLQGRGRPAESGPLDGDRRRSLYLAVRRNFPNPLLAVFDVPVPAATSGRRASSNVPAQALALSNDPFVAGRARAWAERILALDLPDDAARLERMWREALARAPRPEERSLVAGYLAAARRADPASELEPWCDVAHVIFNLEELRFLR